MVGARTNGQAASGATGNSDVFHWLKTVWSRSILIETDNDVILLVQVLPKEPKFFMDPECMNKCSKPPTYTH